MSRGIAWLFALIGLAVCAAIAGSAESWPVFFIGALGIALFISWRRVTRLERALDEERVERIRAYYDLRQRIEPVPVPVPEPVPEPKVEPVVPVVVETPVAASGPEPVVPLIPPRPRKSWAAT